MSFKERNLGLGVVVLMTLTLLVLLTMFQIGCNQDEGQKAGQVSGQPHDVGFSTLAQDVSSEYGRSDEGPMPADSPPECMVITDAESYQRLQSLASITEPVPAVDFETNIVIAAMQGPKNTGGYAISVMHISQEGPEVRVEVDTVEPEPGAIVVQMLTSPYHLVTANRADFDPRGRLAFTFVDQDDIRLSQEWAQI